MKTDNDSHFAKRLLEMQMKIWTEDEKTAADVSRLLDLGTTKCMLMITQPITLDHLVNTGDKARAKQFEAMQKVLPSHYNDDDALIKDLVAR
ncbi:hypothetical protein KXD40_000546 [Peronospora effusa]|nr:hypothetical protein KXD40_000546 [Peronospora effusa]